MDFYTLADIFLHLDVYLGQIIQNYHVGVYALLFLIVFIETGLVIMPFLPGDSLLFIAGTLAASDSLNIFLLFFILSMAAILGDSMNYFAGNYFGKKILARKNLIRKEYLEKTYDFYDKHGNKTIILARFIPIIRTFAPFIAGIGKMNYFRFAAFNIIGGFAWVSIFIFSGYFF